MGHIHLAAVQLYEKKLHKVPTNTVEKVILELSISGQAIWDFLCTQSSNHQNAGYSMYKSIENLLQQGGTQEGTSFDVAGMHEYCG